MIPPRYSAYFSKRLPNFFPNNTHMKERTNVVIPIVTVANAKFTFKKAKLTPTARASILFKRNRMNLGIIFFFFFSFADHVDSNQTQ